MPVCGSEPPATNHQIDGKTLKQFLPSGRSNTVRGTGNYSWYGKKGTDQ